jgi:O-antigen/teichoic acid export membrane protein
MTFDAAISQTVFPEISNASADDMTESVTGLTNESLRFSGLILIPGLVGGMLLSNRLLRIYSPEFMRGSLVLVILILSTLLYGYQRQLLTSLNAVDRPDITFQVNAALIGFNILANTALISTIGWIGAAIATTLSAALGASLAYGGLRRVMDFSVPLASICLQVAASFIMGIVVYGALQIEKSYSFLNNNIMITMMLVTLGAVVYFTVLFAISLEFRKTIRRNLFIDS